MELPATAYVALGSNLGDRLATLRAALDALNAGGVQVLARSPVFETEAESDAPQPLYLNAVVRTETALSARMLLALCLQIEAALGRRRPSDGGKAPRVIDLDLLLFGDQIIDEPDLTVPHPRLLGRPFVRIPLAAIAPPGLRHPVTGDALDRADDPRSPAGVGVSATGVRWFGFLE